MRQVSNAALQAMMAQDTAEVFVSILKITHPSLAGPILRAANTEVVHRADGDYLPYGFKVKLPSQQEDELPSVTITIDNVDLELNNMLRGLVGEPSVVFSVVLASTPDVVEAGPFYYSLKNVMGNSATLQGTLSYEDDTWSQSVPSQIYSPINSRGLYV